MGIDRDRSALGPSFVAEACLAIQFPNIECRRCADECPIDALAVSPRGLTLAPECFGCGRCAARCPTSALAMSNPDRWMTPADDRTADAVTIDCQRASNAELRPWEIRPRCSGGVNANDLLALRLRAGERRIQVNDHGWCVACPAGDSRTHPAARAVDTARQLMRQVGVPESLWPRLARIVADVEPKPFAVAPRPTAGVSRRALLMAMRAPARQPSHGPARRAALTSSAPGGGRKVTPTEQETRVVLLMALAERFGGALPADLLPMASINEACVNHRICLGVCPTGALRVEADDARSTIRFDAVSCIACGVCETSCPENAIRVWIGEDSRPIGEPTALKTFEVRQCVDCDDDFAALDDDTLCPSCRKSRSLFGAIGAEAGDGNRIRT